MIGIFLGLLMMWLVFDQLCGTPALVEMKKQFVTNLRLLAQFAREPSSGNLRIDIERSYALREKINNNFDAVRAAADGVVLEFGTSREQDLAWRHRIIIWQTQLRILFLTRIALWKYRAQLPGFELPEGAMDAQKELDNRSAEMLVRIADRLEGKASTEGCDLEEALGRLEHVIRKCSSERPQELSDQVQAVPFLSRKTVSLECSLDNLVGREARST